MDNEYYMAWFIKERLRELHAEARRDRLARAATRRHQLRMALGTVLIRFGAWLMSEGADVAAPSERPSV